MSRNTKLMVMALVLVAGFLIYGLFSKHNIAFEKIMTTPLVDPPRPQSGMELPSTPAAAIAAGSAINPPDNLSSPPAQNQRPADSATAGNTTPLNGPAQWHQIWARVDNLVQGRNPMNNSEVFQRIQEINRDRDAIQIRSDAVVVSLEENDETHYGGFAYYFPTEGQFYIQWDVAKNGVLPANRHFYGPFIGDPYAVLAISRRADATGTLPTSANNLTH